MAINAGGRGGVNDLPYPPGMPILPCPSVLDDGLGRTRTPCQVFAQGLLAHASLAIAQPADVMHANAREEKGLPYGKPDAEHSTKITNSYCNHHHTPHWIDCTHLGSARQMAPAQPQRRFDAVLPAVYSGPQHPPHHLLRRKC